MDTYETWNQYTESALELNVKDGHGNDLFPDAAYMMIKDANDIEIIPEQPAMVLDNKCLTLVGKKTTNIPGLYDIVWRIIKDEFIYIHISHLEVEEL